MPYRIEGRIVGMSDLLFNRFTEASKDSVDGVAVGGRRTKAERIDEAKTLVYRNAAGRLCIPRANLKKALLDGCHHAKLKDGKSAIAKKVEATVYVADDCDLGVNDPDGIFERSGRRPPRTGGRVIIRRPYLKAGWSAPFLLDVLDDGRPDVQLHAALTTAGFYAGLMDGRPEYGRFQVTNWRVVEPETATKGKTKSKK